MTMITFICLAFVCCALAVINIAFYNLKGWKGILVRGLFVFSLVAFSLIVQNLREIFNAVPMFITLGLGVMLLAEVVYVSMENDDKLKPIVNGSFFTISNGLFAFSLIALAEFNVLALAGGLLTGIGFGLIVCVLNRNKGLNRIIMNILTFASIGAVVGLGLNTVLVSQHFISSIMMFAGGIFLLVHRILVVSGKGKIALYLEKAFMSIALLLITFSMFFY